jgi:activator of HSP90 ATPase
LIVDFAVVLIGAGVQVLFAAEFEQLDAVVRADLVSEVVEEFEHGEGLLRRPIGRDFEVDGERQAGRGLGLFGDHGLAPRR